MSSQLGSNSEPKKDENKDSKAPTLALQWCCRSLVRELGEEKPCKPLYLLRRERVKERERLILRFKEIITLASRNP